VENIAKGKVDILGPVSMTNETPKITKESLFG